MKRSSIAQVAACGIIRIVGAAHAVAVQHSPREMVGRRRFRPRPERIGRHSGDAPARRGRRAPAEPLAPAEDCPRTPARSSSSTRAETSTSSWRSLPSCLNASYRDLLFHRKPPANLSTRKWSPAESVRKLAKECPAKRFCAGTMGSGTIGITGIFDKLPPPTYACARDFTFTFTETFHGKRHLLDRRGLHLLDRRHLFFLRSATSAQPTDAE